MILLCPENKEWTQNTMEIFTPEPDFTFSTEIQTMFNNTSNTSNFIKSTDEYLPSIVAIRASFIFFTALLSLCANILCLMVLPHTTRNIPENNRLLMMSLSAADLGMGLITTLSIAPAIIGHWPYGETMCTLTSSVNNGFSGISILTLVLISLDRYFAVTKPLRYPVIITRKKMIIVAAGVWIIELGFTILIFPFTGAPVIYDSTVAKCTPLWRPGKDTPMLLVTLTITIILPFIIMIFIYVRLFLITRDQVKKIRNIANFNPANATRPMSTHSDRKASRTFFVVTIVFAISWLPYTFTAFYRNLSGAPVHEAAQFFAVWAVVSSSWSDVLTFAGMNSSFRRAAKRMLLKGFAKCLRRDNKINDHSLSVISKETFNNDHNTEQNSRDVIDDSSP